MAAAKIVTVKNGGDRRSDQSANWQTETTVAKAAELLNESQREMAAGRIATVKHGGDRKSNQAANWRLDRTEVEAAKAATIKKGRPKNTSNDVFKKTESEAAESFNVSVPTIQRAKQVIRNGIPELTIKVESGEIRVGLMIAFRQVPSRSGSGPSG